ncbi:MAG: superoxide dismutase [Fe] [Gemmatimonadetes bacterium]|nr:superoxide dismutase [Fe] [Gemmatimonadota bacterium]
MAFQLPPLPWSSDALEPYISAKTMSFHYGKHHMAYVNKLNAAIENTPLAEMSLEQIITETANDASKAGIFNNAAQVWNHTFFWRSMKPGGGGEPTGELAEKIVAAFGSIDAFKEEFATKAATLFGSGWTWLVDSKGSLEIVQTTNAGNPLTEGMTPLLTLDVWEHAYYLDYQNRRPDFIKTYLDELVDWEFAAKNL